MRKSKSEVCEKVISMSLTRRQDFHLNSLISLSIVFEMQRTMHVCDPLIIKESLDMHRHEEYKYEILKNRVKILYQIIENIL